MKENLRIIWAITAKDIIDALKNKNSLANIVMVLFMVLFFKEYDNWLHADDPPNLLLYDAGSSSIVAKLENSSVLDLYQYDSPERLAEVVSGGDAREIGVEIPAGFDQMLAAGGALELEGYVVDWVSDDDAAEIRAEFETELSQVAGQPVSIKLDGNRVAARPEAGGPIISATISLMYVVLMLGVGVVPHLMIEEKNDKTIDALLVSPARSSHLTVAKALTGLFYILTSAVFVYGINAIYINHWHVAILVVLVGALFGTAFGLLCGTLFEVRSQLSLWGFVALALLLLPVFLSIMTDIIPQTALTIMDGVPSVALGKAFWVACSATAPLADYGWRLAYVLLWALGMLAAVAWLVRRSDR